jgi:tRNA dimethylallyltransferase
MNVGTAKPSSEELSRVPHHGIDLVSVSEPFDIGRYLEYSKVVVYDILNRGKKVLITGGSGFYLKCFFAPVIDSIEISLEVKNEVQELYQEKGLSGLVARLKERNGDQPLEIDINNFRRVIPALERCLQTGKTLGELRRDFENQDFPFKNFTKRSCLLERDYDELRQRVSVRAAKMLEDGLVEEVKGLIQDGILKNGSASRSIGYRETIEFIQNDGMTEQELFDQIVINTNRLVKKQRTWFRTQLSFDQILVLSNTPAMPEKLFLQKGL